MYNLNINDEAGEIILEASGNINKQEYNEIINKLYATIEEGIFAKYKVLISITNYNFVFWQLPYIMKLKKLAAFPAVEKMAILLDERFARNYGIRKGVSEYQNQVIFYDKEEANQYLKE